MRQLVENFHVTGKDRFPAPRAPTVAALTAAAIPAGTVKAQYPLGGNALLAAGGISVRLYARQEFLSLANIFYGFMRLARRGFDKPSLTALSAQSAN